MREISLLFFWGGGGDEAKYCKHKGKLQTLQQNKKQNEISDFCDFSSLPKEERLNAVKNKLVSPIKMFLEVHLLVALSNFLRSILPRVYISDPVKLYYVGVSLKTKAGRYGLRQAVPTCLSRVRVPPV